jgi:hypothetical protein
MMKIGVFLFVALVAWIVFSVTTGGLLYPKVSLLGLGNSFEGNLALPKEKIDAAFEAYRVRVLSTAERASYFKLGGEVASWMAFFATAAITLIAGWYGQAPANATGGGTSAASGLPPKAMRLVAMLAALSAVLTATGGLASQQGQSLNSWARDRQHDFIRARNDVVAAKTSQDAQTVLDDLELSLRQ